MSNQFITIYLKLFFVLTPFLLLSTFLTWTGNCTTAERHHIIWRVMAAILVICLVIFMFGNHLFSAMGITLDAFRVGAGILLLISSISLVQGREFCDAPSDTRDIAVVPLAIPVTVGPGTVGMLLVMGNDLLTWQGRLIGGLALLAAVASLGVLLYVGNTLKRTLGVKGVNILSKLTGLVLASLSAQVILQGLQNTL